MVDMLSTGFNAIWKVQEQHPTLYDDRYECTENRVTIKVLSNKAPLNRMEYSDLITLARMLLNFQQVYRLPGIKFKYLEDGQITGVGEVAWNYAASSNQDLAQN